jgi:hypothetical protein
MGNSLQTRNRRVEVGSRTVTITVYLPKKTVVTTIYSDGQVVVEEEPP